MEEEIVFAEREPSFLNSDENFSRLTLKPLTYSITYRLATNDQIVSIFPKKQPNDDLLRPSNFLGQPCYELWVRGKLIGLAVISINGTEFEESFYLTIKLESIYISKRHRKKGFLNCLMQDAGKHAFQTAVTHLVKPGFSMSSKTIHLEVTADLYSLGGQAAVVSLGDVIESLVNCTASSGDIELTVIADNF